MHSSKLVTETERFNICGKIHTSPARKISLIADFPGGSAWGQLLRHACSDWSAPFRADKDPERTARIWGEGQGYANQSLQSGCTFSKVIRSIWLEHFHFEMLA